MKNNKAETFVIDLGGSVAFPENIDTVFIRKFYDFIRKQIKKNRKFIIICGGGFIARKYQKAAGKIINISNEEKDWIGINCTRLNAYFLKTIFDKECNPVILDSRFKVKGFDKYSVIIGCGWTPGCSTDRVSVQIAADLGMKEVIVLGKPDYVYTADFEKDKTARPIKSLSWKEYCKLIPREWKAGFGSPVDPVAARLAAKEKIVAIVADGKKLDNLENILDHKEFKGTTII